MNVELQLIFKGHAPRYLRVRRPAVMRAELTPKRAALVIDDPVQWPERGWLHRLDPRSTQLRRVDVYSAGLLVASVANGMRIDTRGTVRVQWFEPVCLVSLASQPDSRMTLLALKMMMLGEGADADA